MFCHVFWRRIIFFPTVLSRNKMYWDFWINALLIPLKYNKKFMCITYLCAFNCIRGNSRKHGQTLTKLSFPFQKMTENIKQIEAWRKVYSVESVKRKQLKILRQLFLFWQESHKVLTLNVHFPSLGAIQLLRSHKLSGFLINRLCLLIYQTSAKLHKKASGEVQY